MVGEGSVKSVCVSEGEHIYTSFELAANRAAHGPSGELHAVAESRRRGYVRALA